MTAKKLPQTHRKPSAARWAANARVLAAVIRKPRKKA